MLLNYFYFNIKRKKQAIYEILLMLNEGVLGKQLGRNSISYIENII